MSLPGIPSIYFCGNISLLLNFKIKYYLKLSAILKITKLGKGNHLDSRRFTPEYWNSVYWREIFSDLTFIAITDGIQIFQ